MKRRFRLDDSHSFEYVDFLEDGKQWYCLVYNDSTGYIGETIICNTKADAKELAYGVMDDNRLRKEVESNGYDKIPKDRITI